MPRAVLPVSLGLVLALGCAQDSAPELATNRVTSALGEPNDGFPNWYERVIHVWSNRARCDPAADLASCGGCAEAACYTPVPPLVWSHNLGRAARFHSDNLVLSSCGLQHDSPCALVTDIGAQYVPGPCNGAPSCACQGGAAMCGSSGTAWSTRVSRFGTSPSAENIVSGRTDPVSAFYAWLHETDNNPACGWRQANGHRANILGGSRAVGIGKSGSRYTQDFASSGSPDGLVAGVHYPQTGSDIEFRANWYRGAAPSTAMVDVGGTCYSMTVERGTSTNGTYLETVSGVSSGCVRYYFHFTDGATDVFYPTTGSFGINCTNEWELMKPAPCGPCTPDCTGRICGSDGCGGSCGPCLGGRVCNAAQDACECPIDDCYGVCVDMGTDRNNCGMCDETCAMNEVCTGSNCVCVPDCAGNQCGPDGCSGACGTCPTDRTCNMSGSCVCVAGLTECSGACVDTDTDDRHCGTCPNRCRGNETCVSGNCIQGSPDAGVADAEPLDAAVPDAGEPDASSPDAQSMDAAVADAAAADAQVPDAVSPDTGVTDAQSPDALVFDAAVADAQPQDAAPPDASVVGPDALGSDGGFGVDALITLDDAGDADASESADASPVADAVGEPGGASNVLSSGDVTGCSCETAKENASSSSGCFAIVLLMAFLARNRPASRGMLERGHANEGPYQR